MSISKSNPYYKEAISLRQKDAMDPTLELLIDLSCELENKNLGKIRQLIMTISKVNSIHGSIGFKSGNLIYRQVDKLSDNFHYNIMARLVFLKKNLLLYKYLDWYLKVVIRLPDKGLSDIVNPIVKIAIAHKYKLNRDLMLSHQILLIRTTDWLLKVYDKFPPVKSIGTVENQSLDVHQPMNYQKEERKAVSKGIDDILNFYHLFYQNQLDNVIYKLMRGRRGKSLKYLHNGHDELFNLLKDSKRGQKLLSFEVETTKRRARKYNGYYEDYFSTSSADKKRSILYVHYNQDKSANQDLDPSKKPRQTKLGHIFVDREEQLVFLEYIFGFKKNKEGEHVGVLLDKLKPGFSIHDNDYWVRILTLIFKEEFLKPNKQGINNQQVANIAVNTALNLFHEYLVKFTEHAKFNIRDSGENYLEIIYPRTIAGKVIHDCGVYATRITYIYYRFFLSINRTLGKQSTFIYPSFHFVRLPLHVGLLIKLSNGDLMLTHNKTQYYASASEMKELLEKWQKEYSKQKNKRNTSTNDYKTKFFADLSATIFLAGVKQPSLIFDLNTKTKSRRKLRNEIWKIYVRKIAPKTKEVLFNRKVYMRNNSSYQFDLNYLKILEEYRRWHNISLVPFWNNRATQIWNSYSKKIQDKFDKFQKAKSFKTKKTAEKEYKKILKSYENDLINDLELVKKKLDKVNNIRDFINNKLNQYSSILQPGVILTSKHRMISLFAYPVILNSISGHPKYLIKEMNKYKNIPSPEFVQRRLRNIPQ